MDTPGMSARERLQARRAAAAAAAALGSHVDGDAAANLDATVSIGGADRGGDGEIESKSSRRGGYPERKGDGGGDRDLAAADREPRTPIRDRLRDRDRDRDRDSRDFDRDRGNDRPPTGDDRNRDRARRFRSGLRTDTSAANRFGTPQEVSSPKPELPPVSSAADTATATAPVTKSTATTSTKVVAGSSAKTYCTVQPPVVGSVPFTVLPTKSGPTSRAVADPDTMDVRNECQEAEMMMQEQGIHLPQRPFVSAANLGRLTTRVRRELEASRMGQPRPVDATTEGPEHLPEPVRVVLFEHEGQPVLPYSARVSVGPSLEDYATPPATVDDRVAVVLGRAPEVPGKEPNPVRLDVRIGNIEFLDHPLFCHEDLLNGQLRAAFREYTQLHRAAAVSTAPQTLAGLMNLLDANMDTMPDAEFRQEAEDALQLVSELLQTEQALDSLTSRMYRVWKELKAVRAATEARTPASLTVREVLPLADGSNGRLGISIATLRALTHCISRMERLRPPYTDMEKARQLLVVATRLATGHKSYVVRLAQDGTYATGEQCGAPERRRRAAVMNSAIVCRVVLNGNEVGVTQPARLLWPSFSVEVNASMSLQVVKRPETLVVQILEKGWIWSTTLCEIPVPIPGANVAAAPTAALGPVEGVFEFSSSNAMHSEYFEFPHDRYTRGALQVKVSWEQPDMSDVNVAPVLLPERTTQLVGGRIIRVQGVDQDSDEEIPDYAREVDFIEHVVKPAALLDPNDPRNRDVHKMRDWIAVTEARGTKFRPNCLQSDLVFHKNVKAFMNNKRHRLLQLRAAKPDLFTDPVPLKSQEIRNNPAWRSILFMGAIRDEEEEEQFSSQDDAHKAQMHDFLKRMRALGKSIGVQPGPSYDAIVKEGPLPDFKGVDIGQLLQALEPRRRLRPRSKPRQTASTAVTGCDIFVQVVRCQNVPVRRDMGGGNAGTGGRGPAGGVGTSQEWQRGSVDRSMGGYPSGFGATGRSGIPSQSGYGDRPGVLESEAAIVNSFAEILFGQNAPMRTAAQFGPAPHWDEPQRVPFRAPRGDMTPQALLSVQDSIIISLFDELTRYVSGDERDRNTRVSREERYFLGSIQIPFATVYRAGRIEGLFRLDTPCVNLGYRHLSGAGSAVGGASVSTSALGNHSGTYIYLMLTLDPPLQSPPEPPMPPLRGEYLALLNKAQRWKEKYDVDALVMNSRGQWQLPFRYLRPQIPPPDFASLFLDRNTRASVADATSAESLPELNTVHKLARFVSLIPFLNDWQTFAGNLDVWCTSQEFLDLGYGDWEEHAVLLANYFLWLDQNTTAATKDYTVMLAVGTGIPEGESNYVMRKRRTTDEVELWNPATGLVYAAKDELCPLKEIQLLISPDNMWVNLQSAKQPWNCSFDLTSSKLWEPFFTPGHPKPKDMLPIQSEVLTYRRPTLAQVENLEFNANAQLTDALREWRSWYTVLTRHNVGSVLETLMPELERDVRDGVHVDHGADHLNKLERYITRSRIFGVLVQLPLTDVDAILERVKATNIHGIEDSKAAFAIAVHIVPYVNDVMAVWVYVTSLVPE